MDRYIKHVAVAVIAEFNGTPPTEIVPEALPFASLLPDLIVAITLLPSGSFGIILKELENKRLNLGGYAKSIQH